MSCLPKISENFDLNLVLGSLCFGHSNKMCVIVSGLPQFEQLGLMVLIILDMFEPSLVYPNQRRVIIRSSCTFFENNLTVCPTVSDTFCRQLVVCFDHSFCQIFLLLEFIILIISCILKSDREIDNFMINRYFCQFISSFIAGNAYMRGYPFKV